MANRWGKNGNKRLYFLGLQNHCSHDFKSHGDCSHEIKRHFLLGRKAMTNLDSILKSKGITLPTKVCIVKAMFFLVVMYGCEIWTKLLWRTVWRFLKKLEIELPYDPAIPLLGIHTEETRPGRDMCTPMFIAALFIIARTCKPPRCPSADEWIRKLWYIYTMGYYSAIKMNSFESVLMRWMKLEPIIQSEVSQKDKDHYSILTHIYIWNLERW